MSFGGGKFLTLDEQELKKDYSLGEVIGRGGFGHVQLATNKQTGQTFALKFIDKQKFPHMKEEMHIMQDLSHPNVVNLFRIYETKKHYALLMELLKGGELFNAIVNFYPEGYTERDAALIAREVARGLEFLHTKNIVHRDLKPENLLFSQECADGRLDLDRQPQNHLKIIDFGGAKDISNGRRLKEFFGTPNYMAPEMTQNSPYGTEVDMWALGVLIYILLCGYDPWIQLEDDLSNLSELFQDIRSGHVEFPREEWDYVSDTAKDLIKRLLQQNPGKRLTASQVLSHRWFQMVDSDQVSRKRLKAQKTIVESIRGRQKFRALAEAVIASSRLTSRLNSFKVFGGTKTDIAAKLAGTKIDDAPKKEEPVADTEQKPAKGSISAEDMLQKAGKSTRLLLATFKAYFRDHKITRAHMMAALARYRSLVRERAPGILRTRKGDKEMYYVDEKAFMEIFNDKAARLADEEMLLNLYRCLRRPGSGGIEFQEALLYLTTVLNDNFAHKLECAFNIYDINGDGELSVYEIEQMFLRLLPSVFLDQNFETHSRFFEVIREVFYAMDTNNDGSVSLSEFRHYTVDTPTFYELLEHLFSFGLPNDLADAASCGDSEMDEVTYSTCDWLGKLSVYIGEVEDVLHLKQSSDSDSSPVVRTPLAPDRRLSESLLRARTDSEKKLEMQKYMKGHK